MQRSRWSTGISITLLLALGLVLLAPISTVVHRGFLHDEHFSFYWLRQVLSEPRYIEGLINSLALAIATTTLTLVIAIPLALIADRCDFTGKRWWLALIQAPLILPPFVGAIGMKQMLSRNSGINALLEWLGWVEPTNAIDWMALTIDLNDLLIPLGLVDAAHPVRWLAFPNGFLACAVLMALYLYPIAFLNVQAALANIDPALDEAARNLGAGRWRRFWRVTLPLMRPGLFAGGTIVFIWSFTELGTPLMVNFTKLTAVQVYNQVQQHSPDPSAYALVVVLMGGSALLYVIGKTLLGRTGHGMLAKATAAVESRRVRGLRGLLATLPFAIVFLAAVMPHFSVLLNSVSSTGSMEVDPSLLTLRYHADILRDLTTFGDVTRGLAARSVVNSLKYSVIATAACMVLGFGVAYLNTRRQSLLTRALDHVAMLPLAVPGLVMAFGYFAMTQRQSLFGGLFGGLDPTVPGADPTLLLVIAYAVRRLPFMVRSCAAGLEQTSVALEESAFNLGASPSRTIVSIVLPLLTANLIAGSLLVFSRSMLEVSDSLILAFDQATYPMTKAILDLNQLPASGTQLSSALGVWGMLILGVTICGASLALGKRLGALFRV